MCIPYLSACVCLFHMFCLFICAILFAPYIYLLIPLINRFTSFSFESKAWEAHIQITHTHSQLLNILYAIPYKNLLCMPSHTHTHTLRHVKWYFAYYAYLFARFKLIFHLACLFVYITTCSHVFEWHIKHLTARQKTCIYKYISNFSIIHMCKP